MTDDPTTSERVADPLTSGRRVVQLHLPELHKAQIAMKDESKRFNVACCGRRFGKNILLHHEAIRRLIAGLYCNWGSPSYKNLADDWRLLLNILSPILQDKSEQEHRMELMGGGVLEMWSLDNPNVIRGRGVDEWFINEAAQVPDLFPVWNEIIRPTLIDRHGGAWFASTPKGYNGFKQLYQLGIDQKSNPDWISWHYSSYANPYLDPDELDELKNTMTEEQYRQEILAEFVEGAGSVFRNLGACLLAPKLNSPAEHKGHALVAGVDWGKQDDFTVVSVGCRDCMREIELDRYNTIDYAFQRQRLILTLAKWSVHHTIVEANAMGGPILEQLQRDGVQIIGFVTTNPSKVAIVEGLALTLEKGSFQFLPDEVGKAELEAYQLMRTRTGMATYNAPAGMHDDTVIARALMIKAINEVAPGSMMQDKEKRSHAPMEAYAHMF